MEYYVRSIMIVGKRERFALFVRRLSDAPRVSTAEQAHVLLGTTLNGVENEFTTIPFDPSQWASDGRMYPPLAGSARDVPGRADLTRYRSRAHNTYIAANGAIRIETLSGDLVLSKAGRDGSEVHLP